MNGIFDCGGIDMAKLLIIFIIIIGAVNAFQENPEEFKKNATGIIAVIVVFGVGFIILSYICDFIHFIGFGYDSTIGGILSLCFTVLMIYIAISILKEFLQR